MKDRALRKEFRMYVDRHDRTHDGEHRETETALNAANAKASDHNDLIASGERAQALLVTRREFEPLQKYVLIGVGVILAFQFFIMAFISFIGVTVAVVAFALNH